MLLFKGSLAFNDSLSFELRRENETISNTYGYNSLISRNFRYTFLVSNHFAV